MSLIKCPECGKEISDKAISCPNCGCPQSEWQVNDRNYSKDLSGVEKAVFEIAMDYDRKEKTKMILELQKKTGITLAEAKEKIEKFISSEEYYAAKEIKKQNFKGVYRYKSRGRKEEVYCPRCKSENCSIYHEQKIIPQKTKTSYTKNLNPLKPFTVLNKKEKVVRREESYTVSKFICNNCGKIFI